MSGSNVGCGGRKDGCVGGGTGSLGICSDGGSGLTSGGEESSLEKEAKSRVYTKQQWHLVHRWRKIDEEEAFLKAEKEMTDDFNIAGGLGFQEWPVPKAGKIGPYPRKSVCYLSKI